MRVFIRLALIALPALYAPAHAAGTKSPGTASKAQPLQSTKAVVSYSGTISTSPSWSRTSSCGGVRPADDGPYGYQTQTFSVDVAGSYLLETIAATFSGGSGVFPNDDVLVLYRGSFSAANPLANCIAYDDDSGPAFDLAAAIIAPLEANQTYVLVTSTYEPQVTGTFTNRLSGPGNIALVGGGGVTALPFVSVFASPSRVTQTSTVTIQWEAANVTACTVSGGQPNQVFTAVPGANRVTTTVQSGTTVRNDVFRVSCTGPNGSVVGSTVVAAGVPPPPPAQPVASVGAAPGGGAANGASSGLSLSDGARFVAFESAASNLVSGDTNGTLDVFVRNTGTGQIVRASSGDGGTQINRVSGDAKLSRNGQFVTYTQGTGFAATSGTPSKLTINGGQVCRKNLANSTGFCFSKSPQGADGNGASGESAVSGDGNVVLYESTATNLGTTPDTNGAVSDVFAYDVPTNTTTKLSVNAAGAQGTSASGKPAISCNARHFAFESASALGSGATQAGVRNIYYAGFGSGTGKRLVSTGLGGVAANGDSSRPKVTDDGRFVFFESSASNLVGGDTNGASDIFVADLAANTIRRLSVSAAGTQGNGASQGPVIPCDGATMSFESVASNLVAGDNNGRSDVFVVNMGSYSISLASQSGGSPTNGQSSGPAMSPDGTETGFDSDATNLPGSGGGTGVYTGNNPFATQNYTGAWYDPAQSGHGIFIDQLPDGRLVAWWFTFDPAGAQAWFGGAGELQGTSAVVPVSRTLGGQFIPNFVTANTRNLPIGTLTFNFSSCSRGRVNFALDSTFGTGFMDLTRLSSPIGVNCEGAGAASAAKRMDLPGWESLDGHGFGEAVFKATELATGPVAGLTGAWYDPAQSGHGLFMENLGNGSVLAWWFTFAPGGGQAWFGGVGTILDANRVQITFRRTTGGRWIPNFNPALVSNPEIGTVTLNFSSCNGGRVDFQFAQGFGTGSMVLNPLFRSVGTACDD
ncbi:MAG TPA: hypothetical protein PLC02_10120 [Pseudomonadota bacterium]|nr:hypothetical protein [Pseudomonadota bacterium]